MSIGQTQVKISTIIEHALLRVGMPVEMQTPAIVDQALNNLHFILSTYQNTSNILWAMDEHMLPLVANQATYTSPAGTVDIRDINFRTLTYVTGTDTAPGAGVYQIQFDEQQSIQIVKMTADTASISIDVSDDGVVWYTVTTINHTVGTEFYKLPSFSSKYYIRATPSTGTVTTLKTATGFSDIMLFRFNRNDYMMLPNKNYTGKPNSVYVSRELIPEITLWPVPSNTYAEHTIHYVRQRQIADIGALTDTLEIPQRWLEATTWQLAKNMAFELPQIDPSRIQLCVSMAEKSKMEVEFEERDTADSWISPDIGVYTR